ncbi:TPA: hypothetical protein DCZ32_02750 [Candidatus Uhrbacteria bacterium]|nr:hypothetical protein [Candidatus Uhrbacteria bacterium]
MAVPAHDERDFEFAKKFNLPIRPVVLKKQEQSRSFVMGVDESELKNLGIVIVDKTDDGFFKILIPFERIEEYKEFIRSKMSNGFWNEYSTAVGFDFIFKHKDGRLEEMGLDKETNDLIDRYGMTFNGEEPKEHPDNVYSWLAKNEFYADILIHTEDGIAINSGEFDGQSTSEFKKNIIVWLEKNGKGKAKINYKLRDWVFSRQRYWGEPIPLINCEKCGWVPVADKDLPVVLPEVEKYEPTDSGESPLASISKWVNTKCPNCKGLAKRETDTMPNWAGSSWYFLRYIDPKNKKSFADAKKLDYWMPVDWYNGGMEHTTLHLLYSRFWNKFLFDQGLVPFSEPYTKRTSHGLIMSSDGTKMSKSKGNVVNPDDIVNEYGADTLRLYEMFVGPFDQPVPWDPKGVLGVRRFLEKVWSMQEKIGSGKDEKLERELHKTIKKVSEDIESMKFNTAVAQMMKFVNEAHNSESVPRDIYVLFLTMLNPFAPHMTNEIFESLKGKDFLEKSQWPAFNPELAKDDFVEIAVQVAGKLRGTVQASPQATESEVAELAQKVENVQKYLSGSRVRRVVYVKGRMINFVI